jgi:hypothetical protein
MPHNNRVSASSALKTNDIWSKTIGYDPYAATNSGDTNKINLESLEQNESLKLLVKMSNLGGSDSRGGCKKCGMLGHLTFQCRNSTTTVDLDKRSELSSSSSSSDDSGSESGSCPDAKRRRQEENIIRTDISSGLEVITKKKERSKDDRKRHSRKKDRKKDKKKRKKDTKKRDKF